MRTVRRTSLPLLLILLGVFACALPATPQVDQNAAGTAVAQTLAVIIKMTQDAGNGVSLDWTDTPTVTSTGTITPEPTSTPTSTLPPTWTPTSTPTFTSFVPMISVSVATNCRVGPGKVYRIVGALVPGDVVQVYARDPGREYWYIQNPDNPGHYCWVWGEFATVYGVTSGLPIYTPPAPPTPTFTATPHPSFDASSGGIQACSGYWVNVNMKNTGTLTFQSVSLTIRDTVTSKVLTSISDGFNANSGCGSVTKRKVLAPGKTVGQSSPKFGYNPDGHKLRATVTLCSGLGLNGVCVTDTIVFTP